MQGIYLTDFYHGKIHFIGRNANFAAHNLAKMAVKLGIAREWLEEIPSCIS
jgi:hypothetical protein